MKKTVIGTKFVWLVLTCMVIISMSGCASTKMPKTSGFLNSYKGFEESEVYKGVFVKRNANKTIGDYDKFLIDDIIVYFIDEGWTGKVNPMKLGVNAKKLSELTQYFHETVLRALKEQDLRVVDKRGPGVLRIRIALTDVDRNLPILNVYGYQTLTGVGIGGASMEGAAEDSMTGEHILSVVTRKKGGVMPELDDRNLTKMNDAKSYTGEAIDNKIDSLSYWNTIKDIMDNWADRFAKAVVKAHDQP